LNETELKNVYIFHIQKVYKIMRIMALGSFQFMLMHSYGFLRNQRLNFSLFSFKILFEA